MNIKRKIVHKILLSILVMVCVFGVQYVASADDYLLTTEEVVTYQEDVLTLSSVLGEEELVTVRYEIAETSENPTCVAWKEEGVLSAVEAGKATIRVIYTTVEQAEEKVEELSVVVREPEVLELSYGQMQRLQAYDVYHSYDMEYIVSNDSLALSEEGVTIQGFDSGIVYVNHDENRVPVAKIEVQVPMFEREHMTRAMQTEAFAFPILNYSRMAGDDTIQWKTKEESIATASEEGILAMAEGTTTLTAELTARNGQKMTLEGDITVTNPAFVESQVVVAIDGKKKVNYTGVSKYSTYGINDIVSESDTDSESNSVVRCAEFVSKEKITGVYEAVENITWVVDGRTLTIEVVTTNPHVDYLALSIQRGKTKNIGMKGLNKQYSSITYESLNKNIATINKTGKVKAKKVGNAKIKVKADGKTFKVCIEISTKKGYCAAKKEIAISNMKTQYSQIKRMQKGYYDCSSLVSRVYRQYNVYFGVKSGWSPTAAAIGQWCESHGKVIAKKGVSYQKLVPGDLIFYSYKKNGRYRNISHVEMYVGNGMSVSASSRNNRVIHYGYSQYKAVLVARPTS